MFDLIKTDFYRIFKSKTFYVILAICIGLPLFTVLMTFGVNKGLNALIGIEGEDFNAINGKLLISGIYGLSSNVGLILPIFLVIFVNTDVSNGLLRNKLLVGKSRLSIYFSHLIVITILSVAFITLSSLIISPLTFWLVPYSSELNGDEIRSIIFYYILGTLSFVFIASLVVMLTLNFNHVVFPIIIIVLFGIGIMLLTQIIALIPFEMLDQNKNIPSFLIPVIKELPYFIPIYTGNSFAFGQIKVLDFIFGIISLVIFTALADIGGAISFKNKEIK